MTNNYIFEKTRIKQFRIFKHWSSKIINLPLSPYFQGDNNHNRNASITIGRKSQKDANLLFLLINME
jgi:hypothetical protein